MEPTTFLLLMIAVLLGFSGVIYGVWLYFEKSKPERLKRVKKESSIDPEDEAYNAVMTGKSICRVLKNSGHDVSSAEIILERAELALQSDDNQKAIQLAEEAKNKIEQAKERGKTTPAEILDSTPPKEPKSEAVKEFEKAKEKIQNLPDNYMESKFEIDVARDMVEEDGDTEARRLLDMAEESYSAGDYTQALSYAVRCKKWIDEDSAGLLAGQRIGKREPVEEKKTEISVKNLSTPEEKKESDHRCDECGNKVSTDDKFCNRCGAKLDFSTRCPNCGGKVEPEFNFCSGCGEELVPTVFECPECETEVDEDTKFCPSCGVELE